MKTSSRNRKGRRDEEASSPNERTLLCISDQSFQGSEVRLLITNEADALTKERARNLVSFQKRKVRVQKGKGWEVER